MSRSPDGGHPAPEIGDRTLYDFRLTTCRNGVPGLRAQDALHPGYDSTVMAHGGAGVA